MQKVTLDPLSYPENMMTSNGKSYMEIVSMINKRKYPFSKSKNLYGWKKIDLKLRKIFWNLRVEFTLYEYVLLTIGEKGK